MLAASGSGSEALNGAFPPQPTFTTQSNLSGSLLKRSRKLRVWNTRWCNVDPRLGMMEWRKLEEDVTPNGWVDLRNAEIDLDKNGKVYGEKELCIPITDVQGTLHIFCAETESDFNIWYKYLKALLENLEIQRGPANSDGGDDIQPDSPSVSGKSQMMPPREIEDGNNNSNSTSPGYEIKRRQSDVDRTILRVMVGSISDRPGKILKNRSKRVYLELRIGSFIRCTRHATLGKGNQLSWNETINLASPSSEDSPPPLIIRVLQDDNRGAGKKVRPRHIGDGVFNWSQMKAEQCVSSWVTLRHSSGAHSVMGEVGLTIQVMSPNPPPQQPKVKLGRRGSILGLMMGGDGGRKQSMNRTTISRTNSVSADARPYGGGPPSDAAVSCCFCMNAQPPPRIKYEDRSPPPSRLQDNGTPGTPAKGKQNVSSQPPPPPPQSPLRKNEDSLFSSLASSTMATVQDSILKLNENDVVKLGKSIKNAKSVFCFGEEREGLAMQLFIEKLQSMGQEAYFARDPDAKSPGKGDVLIISDGFHSSMSVTAAHVSATVAGAEVIMISSVSKTAISPGWTGTEQEKNVLLHIKVSEPSSGCGDVALNYELTLIMFLDIVGQMLRLELDDKSV